jgi:citrate synthase
MEDQTVKKGLEGVIAAKSEVCDIDGERGRLFYRGYSIEELARYSTFEEVTFLLLNEHLPTAAEFEQFSKLMRLSRDLAPQVKEMIRAFPINGSIMELLQSCVSYLSGYVEHRIQHSATCNCRDTLHQVAQIASVVAATHRFRQGKEYVAPRPDFSHGANFLYMLHGTAPDEDEGRVMDTLFLLQAEHGFNASTFTARVVASTMSTCYCGISAAIGALAGSLHGGASERAIDMLEEIGSPENVGPWLDKALAAKRKVMGMGHRVYKVKDPRAVIIEEILRRLSEKRGDYRYYRLLKKVEEEFIKRFDEQGKPIRTNVDFFSGAVYSLLGIPRNLFTPIFAAARAPGWLAHILEQRKDNRLYRPSSLYTGAAPRRYTALENRQATS